MDVYIEDSCKEVGSLMLSWRSKATEHGLLLPGQEQANEWTVQQPGRFIYAAIVKDTDRDYISIKRKRVLFELYKKSSIHLFLALELR